MRKSLVLLLASLILISGGGVFMSVHRCLSSNHSEISLSGNHSCCGDEKEDKECESLKSKCCSISTFYSKVEVVSYADQKLFPIADVHVSVCETPIQIIPSEHIQISSFHAPPPVESPVIAFRQLLI